ncbi:uncharacterized protein LOC126622959 [Malus sylvestris]|uniref:uncharacterized protein LOC126622959 n=1 Tax=Malus sylvestris TaxID=3752 RepID=UPI0021ABDB57|nr:uncharacterized protein LOC126622959 [Malus sylvestris]
MAVRGGYRPVPIFKKEKRGGPGRAFVIFGSGRFLEYRNRGYPDRPTLSQSLDSSLPSTTPIILPLTNRQFSSAKTTAPPPIILLAITPAVDSLLFDSNPRRCDRHHPITVVENTESSVYLLKFRQLQSRALGMIRSHVPSVLKCASSQVQAAIRGSGGNNASVSEGVEASVIYVRFKAAASELKPVLEEIESRASRKEYTQILTECHKLYCEQRLSLVS